jgi:hypothetical protein
MLCTCALAFNFEGITDTQVISAEEIKESNRNNNSKRGIDTN